MASAQAYQEKRAVPVAGGGSGEEQDVLLTEKNTFVQPLEMELCLSTVRGLLLMPE